MAGKYDIIVPRAPVLNRPTVAVSRSSRTRQYTFRATIAAVHAKMVNNKRPRSTKLGGNNDKSLFLVLDYIVMRGWGWEVGLGARKVRNI